jgi:hypothetical protein
MVKTRILGWTAAVLTLVLIGALGYKAWPLLFPRPQEQVAWHPDCDLRAGPCESALPGGGRVSLEISPSSIPTVQPLQLHVRLQGPVPKVSRVLVDFSGVDMNMGFNRVQLQPQGDGGFAGEGMLPVCVRMRMQWQARVLLETESGLVSADYRFWTARPGEALP